MFGDLTFAEAPFASLSLIVIVIKQKNVHGRTKIVAIVDGTTGQALVINPVKYHATTKVTKGTQNLSVKTISTDKS
jgi:hypothetical protein